MKGRPRRIRPAERRVLAGALGDTPESVISVHLLAGWLTLTSREILHTPMA